MKVYPKRTEEMDSLFFVCVLFNSFSMSSVLLLLAVNFCLLAREQLPRSFELFTNVQEKTHNILISEDSASRAQIDGPKHVWMRE